MGETAAGGSRRPECSAAQGARPIADLARPRHVHLVGVGGAGMSAIATVLAAMGHRVTGSDAVDSPVLARLAGLGVEVHVGPDPRWMGDPDIVAVSTAIPANDPEVVEAHQRGLPVWRRSDILAAICRQRRTVAVSGTHGKTTTSAMLATILRGAGTRPAMIVGGDLVGLGSGAAWEPGGEWLVVEADESDGTFLALGAEAVVVTSVGSDHADFYGGQAALAEAFVRYVEGASGPAVICLDDPGAAMLATSRRPDPRIITYGTDPAAAIGIVDVELHGQSAAFSLVDRRADGRGSAARPCAIGVPGLHNVRNATAAATMALALGVRWDAARAALEAYQGVARRFETRGERAGVTYIDDYAHNPEKVAAAIATARDGEWGRVVAVFQPHRYSRTEALWREFGPALGGPDVLFVTDVYPAGEPARPGVTGRLILDSVAAAHPGLDVRYTESLEQVAAELRQELRAGDLCLTLGAGDITRLPDLLLRSPGTAGA